MFSAFVFLAVGVLCSAASNSTTPPPPPKHCESPNQWEGTAWFFQADAGVTKLIRMSYDNVNKRLRSVGRTLTGPFAGFSLEMILLYKESRFYFLIGDAKLCIESNELDEWVPAGVPSDATYRYHVVRGLGKNSVTTNTWAKSYQVGIDQNAKKVPWSHDNHHHHGHTHTWFASFTDDLCVPVLETIYEGNLLDKEDIYYRTEILDEIRYSGVSAGIKDPSVFDPPSYCNSGGSKNATLLAMLGDKLQWHRYMFV